MAAECAWRGEDCVPCVCTVPQHAPDGMMPPSNGRGLCGACGGTGCWNSVHRDADG